MVKYQFEDDYVTGVWIQCTNSKKLFPCPLYETVTIDTIPVFIKAIVFHHVSISWMTQTKEKFNFSVDEDLLIGLEEDHCIKQ